MCEYESDKELMARRTEAIESVAADFQARIHKKCREHCGMRRAWEDGLCHAEESMCSLVPHSPFLARKAPGRVLDPKPTSTPTGGFEDL